MEKNIYKTSAKFYDGGNGRNFSEDINFYKKYIKPGMSILDIGCGTGRAAIELSKEDISITGIDLSDEMLKVFAEKYEKLSTEQQKRIKFQKGDMTDFEINEKFDLIILPFRVFQALTEDKQRKKALIRMKEHLAADGKIIINIFNPDFKILDNFNTLNKIDYEYFDDALNVSVLRRSIGEGHDNQKKTIKVKYIFEIKNNSGETEIIEDFIELGYMEKEEAATLFKESGLEVENIFAWWDGSLYNENEKRELIFILN